MRVRRASTWQMLVVTSMAAAPLFAQTSPSAPTDSVPADSVPTDSVPADSNPADSNPADSVPADSAPADTVTETAIDPANSAPATTPAALADSSAPRIGDPVAYTRREPMTRPLAFAFGLRYGLVGSGPTRFVDDIRFGVFEWLELRTALLPYPSSLMVRGAIGTQQGDYGVLLLDGGLAHFDAGFRLVPDTGEAKVGIRFHFEGGVAYAKSFGQRLSVYSQVHYRYRLSPTLPNDDQHALAADAHLFYDLTNALAVGIGLGGAAAIITPVREIGINFVETDQPGMSHLIARDEGKSWSLTVPLSMTYGRVENFDVDLFCTPRVFPEFGILFGAGVRLRLDPIPSYFKDG